MYRAVAGREAVVRLAVCALWLGILATNVDSVRAVDKWAVETVAEGLAAPNLAIHAGDGSGRLFVVDQAGQIRIIDANGDLLPTPFLDLADRMVSLGIFGPGTFDERGLLGLAFHPEFVSNRRFYVYYSAPQPAPDPLTFEGGDPIPGDVSFSGNFVIGTQFQPRLYCSGTRAFEVPANGSASITFAEPVISCRFFLVHKPGATAGTVTPVLDDGSSLASITSNLATFQCDPNNFFEVMDFNLPIIGVKRLDLRAGSGTGLTLFLDDLEIQRFDHLSRVSEFLVSSGDPNVANPNSERVIFEGDQPQFNHNSGTLAFGPDDGLLYISFGDGGNGNDVGPFHNDAIGNGQDTTRLNGSILRIDVDSDDFPGDPDRNYGIPASNPFAATPGCADGCDEIFAYGLRNPFRCSFDAGGDHDFFCGDAGQDLFEEVSIVGLGQNMGWRIKEGTHCFDPDDPFNPPDTCPDVGLGGEPLVDPIIEYPHFEDNDNQTGPIGQVVIGGFVYRGSDFPALAGRYVFGDFSRPPFGGPSDGSLFLGTETAPGVWQRTEPFVANGDDGRIKLSVHGFGQDADGEVYVCTSGTGTPFGTTGAVFKIVPANGDMNGDGQFLLDDIAPFVAELTSADPSDRTDVNYDDATNGLDVQAMVNALLMP